MRAPSFTIRKGTIIQSQPLDLEIVYTIKYDDGSVELIATGDRAYHIGNLVTVEDNGIECYIRLRNEESH